METMKNTIGYAFSGGGIRGVAHLGALKALEEEGLKPDVISGTSAGAIVGSLYSHGYKAEEILTFVKSLQLIKVIKLGWPVKGFGSLGYLIRALRAFNADLSFDNCQCPLFITMTNLHTGKLEVKREGDLLKSVAASCAIPMVFEPIEMEDKLFVDGGVVKNLPASIIRDHCGILIGFNVMPSLEVSAEGLRSLVSVAARTFEMSIWRNQDEDIAVCDHHIAIKGLDRYSLFNLSQIDEIFNAGYEAAQKMLPEILSSLNIEAEGSAV